MTRLTEKNFQEIVLQVVGRLDVKIFDNKLSRRDRITFVDAISIWVSMFFTKTNLSEYTKKSFYFTLRRMLCPMEEVDLELFFDMLKEVDGLIRDHNITSYSQLRENISPQYRRLYGGLSPFLQADFEGLYIFQDVYSFEENFKRIHDLLSFPSRITFVDVPGLEESAIADYKDFEASYKIASPSSYMISRASELFPYSDITKVAQSCRPKHGSGSVAEGTSDLLEKYKLLQPSSAMSYFYRHTDDDLSVPSYPFVRSERLIRRSRVTFVPKSSTRLRTICMEPATLMYHQQGAMSTLSTLLKRNDLSRRVKLQDQTQNRELALEGSLTGDLCTIDLSNASDSVGASFSKELFRKTSLRDIVYLLRSSTAELPDGTIIPLNKLSPMGSAICFPIECIVFCLIIEDAIVACGDRPSASRYSVYGDDLIIEKKYVSTLIDKLTEYGFYVNTSKSYYSNSWFSYRESCGGEYINGYDVTPTKISRKFSGFTGNYATVVPTLIDVANMLLDHGYDLARKMVLNHLPNLPILFSNNEGPFLHSKNDVNRRPDRWNSALQVFETRGFALRGLNYVPPINDVNEEILLSHALFEMQSRKPELDCFGNLLSLEAPVDAHRIAKRGARHTKVFYQSDRVGKTLLPEGPQF